MSTDGIEKALLDLEKQLDSDTHITKVTITITLIKPKPGKAIPDEMSK